MACKVELPEEAKYTFLAAKARLNELYMKIVMGANPLKPLVQDPRYIVSNESLRRLRPGTWLNDELINAYVSLVNTRLAQ